MEIEKLERASRSVVNPYAYAIQQVDVYLRAEADADAQLKIVQDEHTRRLDNSDVRLQSEVALLTNELAIVTGAAEAGPSEGTHVGMQSDGGRCGRERVRGEVVGWGFEGGL